MSSHRHDHPHPHPRDDGHDHGEHGHDHGEHGHDHGEHGHDHGEHGHDHGEHGHDHATGIKGVLQGIFAPHSHDAADSIDDALEASSAGIRAVKISLVVLGLTAVLQVAVVAISGSVALLADTIHNFSDALTAVPLWIAFALSRRAATKRFTYGYGRAEDLAGLFVLLMIALSAGVAGYEAIRRLLDPQPIENLTWVAVAGLIGFLGNEAVAVYRIRVGRRIGSAALVADGLHARTDGFTSLAVLFGAGGVALGFPIADPIVGLLITVAIAVVLWGAARDVLGRLMDGVDPALVTTAERALTACAGVREVRAVRMRWVGHELVAEAELDVDPTLSLAQAHGLAHDAERDLTRAVRKLTRATVHAYPSDQHGRSATDAARAGSREPGEGGGLEHRDRQERGKEDHGHDHHDEVVPLATTPGATATSVTDRPRHS